MNKTNQRFLAGFILAACTLFALAWTATDKSFNTNQFGTNSYQIAIKSGAIVTNLSVTNGVTVIGDVTVADEAYGAGWDGSTEVPTKNALYDKIQTLTPGGTPGGSTTQVQFNDGGSFGGDSGLTFNKTTDLLTAVGGLRIGLTAGGGDAGYIYYADGTTKAIETDQSLGTGISIKDEAGTDGLRVSVAARTLVDVNNNVLLDFTDGVVDVTTLTTDNLNVTDAWLTNIYAARVWNTNSTGYTVPPTNVPFSGSIVVATSADTSKQTTDATSLTNYASTNLSYYWNTLAAPTTNTFTLNNDYTLLEAAYNVNITNIVFAGRWGTLAISNASASTIAAFVTTANRPIGTVTSNGIQIASGKMGYLSFLGNPSKFTNWSAAVEP